jgi:hypothetical protein
MTTTCRCHVVAALGNATALTEFSCYERTRDQGTLGSIATRL